MRRIQNHYYQQKVLILIAPLLLIAIVTWLFDPKSTPFFSSGTRKFILESIRIIAPGVLSLLITLIVPINKRPLQLCLTAFSYCILLILMKKFTNNQESYPVICSLCSTCSVLVFLPKNDEQGGKLSSLMLKAFFALILPVVVAMLVHAVMVQLNIFIKASYTQSFLNSDLSVIYVPIYTILQAFGFHQNLADLSVLSTPSPKISAFYNSILMNNLIVLPTAIMVRSLFTQHGLRIFLTFLGICAFLCSSIGTSISFIIIFIIFFFPGTFIAIALSECFLFFLSLKLEIPPQVRGLNLYRPDINMAFTNIIYNIDQLKTLVIASIIMPTLLITLLAVLRFDYLDLKKQKLHKHNLSLPDNLKKAPDLQVIALLRALGGLNNIRQVTRQSSLLFIHVHDQQLVSYTTLNTICSKKAGFDRVRKSYKCDLGQNSHIIERRLNKLLEDVMGSADSEVKLAQPFFIQNKN